MNWRENLFSAVFQRCRKGAHFAFIFGQMVPLPSISGAAGIEKFFFVQKWYPITVPLLVGSHKIKSAADTSVKQLRNLFLAGGCGGGDVFFAALVHFLGVGPTLKVQVPRKWWTAQTWDTMVL